MHPFIRVLRVIGGLSILTVVLQKHLLLFYPVQYIVLFVALINMIYFVVLSFIKLMYGIHIIKRGDLNIINSPIDNFATMTGKLLYC